MGILLFHLALHKFANLAILQGSSTKVASSVAYLWPEPIARTCMWLTLHESNNDTTIIYQSRVAVRRSWSDGFSASHPQSPL